MQLLAIEYLVVRCGYKNSLKMGTSPEGSESLQFKQSHPVSSDTNNKQDQYRQDIQRLFYRRYELVRRRAAYVVYVRYRINRYELSYLGSLSALLSFAGKEIISKNVFVSNVTANNREKVKMEGYLKGCIDRGFIELFEYKLKPGSKCLSITALGKQVLQDFDQSVDIFMDRYSVEPKRVKNERKLYTAYERPA